MVLNHNSPLPIYQRSILTLDILQLCTQIDEDEEQKGLVPESNQGLINDRG